MELEKIGFYTFVRSQYQVLNHFTQKLYEAFLRTGLQCRLFHDTVESLNTLFSDPPDLLIGFNGIPYFDEHNSFPKRLKIPHLACLVDPPYRFWKLLSEPYVILGLDDKYFCQMLDQAHFPHRLFLPHAVEPELYSDEKQKPIYDVVMLASFIDYEQRRNSWKTLFPSNVCRILDEAIEMTFADQHTSFVLAYNIALNRWKDVPKDLDFAIILSELEMYLKGKDRVDLLKSMHDQPVHVFGALGDSMSWQDCFSSNIIFHGPVNYPKALEIMKQSKIILNSCIKNKNGAHERIFTGLMCGALVLTNENPYLQSYFTDEENILFYRHEELPKILDKVNKYLEDESARQRMVHDGREIVLRHHTWDQRAASLLKDLPPLIQSLNDHP